jgi:hypothetical protein
VRDGPLYKFMSRRYADAALRSGDFRIGTLFDFRRAEHYGAQVGDAGEGTIERHRKVIEDKWSAETVPDFGRGLFNFDEGGFVTFKNLTMIYHEGVPNYYIYSTCSALDRDVMASLGYDSCLVIVQPSLFFQALSHRLRHRAVFEDVRPCVYTDRTLMEGESPRFHPALVKPKTFSNQKEVRAVWKPLTTDIAPILVRSRKAASHCKLETSP